MNPRWRLIISAVTSAVVIFCAATARLFIWPANAMPAHVSAIVMLAGPGDRLELALQLARERRAQYLVVSRGHEGYGGPCPRPVPRVRLICFEPSPASTRGEAEHVTRLASRYPWHSLALVTTTVQDSRARQRVERCFAGPVYVMTVGLRWTSWPAQIAYEWAATVKMMIWQRSC